MCLLPLLGDLDLFPPGLAEIPAPDRFHEVVNAFF